MVINFKSQLQIKILTAPFKLPHRAAICSQTLSFPNDQNVSLHTLENS